MDIPSVLAAVGALIGVISTSVVVVLRQTQLLATWERLRHERTVIRSIREQRRMAEMSLTPGSHFTHLTPDGGRLSIRTAPSPVAPGDASSGGDVQ
ncbi:hypothetical protein ACFU5O_18390 [Streptomyces sp. NPDC057445]|uniref:hypothetical protein n=1 Tax=Streptomyces sp. NPDC057445 TaxID=3346136 RepID=UPI0036A49E42